MNDTKQVDYTDGNGLPRRVLLPDNGMTYSPEEGIPLDLYDDLDDLYKHMPDEFKANLIRELWARDLIEPADFMQASAPDRYRQAMLMVIKYDAMNAISLAKERLDHGPQRK